MAKGIDSIDGTENNANEIGFKINGDVDMTMEYVFSVTFCWGVHFSLAFLFVLNIKIGFYV